MELVFVYLGIQILLWSLLKSILRNLGIGVVYLDNPNMTMEMIEKHLEKSWNWSGISCNPNITMDMIEKHPEKPWELAG